MTLGIAFEGCAGRSAFSVGAALELIEQRVWPAIFSGASSGAIVAAFLAAGRPAELESAWLRAAGRPVFRPGMLLHGRWPFRMSDVVGEPLRQAFGDQSLTDLPHEVAIPVTLMSLRGRRHRLLTRQDTVAVVDAVLASCFVPGPYSRVIRIDGHPAFDGAWRIRTPLDDCTRLGASRVIAVHGHPRDEIASGFPFARHLPVPERCRVLRPSRPVPVGAYDTDLLRIRATIGAGRHAAREFLTRNADWLDQAG